MRRAGPEAALARCMALCLAWCILVLACTSADNEVNAEASAATSTAVAAAVRNACELLTAGEVAAVHGGPVEAVEDENGRPGQSTCLYSPPGSTEWQVMWLTVHWQGGREEWERQQAGRGIGTRMMGAEGEDHDGITRPDPLEGVGDAAYYGGVLPSLVLEGDVLLEFMMPLLRNDREHFPELARKAVGRL